MDIMKSYEEWKKRSRLDGVLSEASKLTEALISENGFTPEQEGDEDGHRGVIIIRGLPPIQLGVSLEPKRRLFELSDILFKIEGMRVIYSQAVEEDSPELKAKIKEILEGLFSLAHMKLDQAREALFVEPVGQEESPVTKDQNVSAQKVDIGKTDIPPPRPGTNPAPKISIP